MRSRSLCVLVAAVALAGAWGCFVHSWPSPPPGWVPTHGEAQRHERGFGNWGLFEARDGRAQAEGELIAIGVDSLYVLTPVGVRVLPTAGIERATFAEFYWSSGATKTTRVSGRDLVGLRRHARFPQGPPAGLDLRSLRPR